jgi:hypothetical protein
MSYTGSASLCLLSVPVTETVKPNSAFVQYQSIDKPMPHIDQYKCHLKDKTKLTSAQYNDNKMVAASWSYQMMNGLNTVEGTPLVALSVQNAGIWNMTINMLSLCC